MYIQPLESTIVTIQHIVYLMSIITVKMWGDVDQSILNMHVESTSCVRLLLTIDVM